LRPRPGSSDYWRGEGDLAVYDATFAQRIGWKWDFVLGELARRGWSPPEGDVLDWGCGTGIASRRFLAHFGSKFAGAVVLHDRSSVATDFASRRVKEAFPAVAVRRQNSSPSPACTLLASHVLGELSDGQVDELLGVAAGATVSIWVEPGTHEVSRRLITGVREPLRGEFRVAAPCTHQAACGLLAAGIQRHWCHHFAAAPPEVFMDGGWARFARRAGIDLRGLPLSFLVLDRRGPIPLPPGAVRVIGRPRIRKDAAILFGCEESGVRDRRLAKRAFPTEYRACKRGRFDTLQTWRLEGDQIVAASAVLPEE
jgi:SAM-dependent methyltransferase